MTPRNRKIAVFVGAAALAGGAGIGVAARGDSATTGSSPQMTRPGGLGAPPPGGPARPPDGTMPPGGITPPDGTTPPADSGATNQS